MATAAFAIGAGAALGLTVAGAVAGGQVSPAVRAVITTSQVRFVCAERDLASATASLRVVLENVGSTPAALPASGLVFGSERYWLAGTGPSADPVVSISGKLILHAAITPAPAVPAVTTVVPSARHPVAAEHGLVVAPTGVAGHGILVPGAYRVRLQVMAGFTADQIDALRRRPGPTLPPLWADAVWSEPFDLVVPPVPAGLAACAP
jgi:hypothetical protein